MVVFSVSTVFHRDPELGGAASSESGGGPVSDTFSVHESAALVRQNPGPSWQPPSASGGVWGFACPGKSQLSLVSELCFRACFKRKYAL